jgi:hypothetical protein
MYTATSTEKYAIRTWPKEVSSDLVSPAESVETELSQGCQKKKRLSVVAMEAAAKRARLVKAVLIDSPIRRYHQDT